MGRGNPKCHGKIKTFYPDVLSLKRTDKGILICVSSDDFLCSNCRKRVSCFSVFFRDELKIYFLERSIVEATKEKNANKKRAEEIASVEEADNDCKQL